MTAFETVQTYFDALTVGDAQKLIALMAEVSYYVKIGTDENEFVEGGENAGAYYQYHVDSAEDFVIAFDHLDVQERDTVAWFYTRQRWALKWQGEREELNMRLTGVLEREGQGWKFVQIHASIGVPSNGD